MTDLLADFIRRGQEAQRAIHDMVPVRITLHCERCGDAASTALGRGELDDAGYGRALSVLRSWHGDHDCRGARR